MSATLFTGHPTWIIKIISPIYREHDTKTKRDEYRELNVEEYWLVDPEYKTIEIVRFSNNVQVYSKVFLEGVLRPGIVGFEEFGIDLESLWKLS